MAKEQEVTIVFDGLVGFYTAEPVLREMVSRGNVVHIACRKKHVTFVRDRLPGLKGTICYLDDLIPQFLGISRFYRIMEILLTSHDFSYQYRLLSHPRNHGYNVGYRLVYYLSKHLPPRRHEMINSRLKRLFSRFVHNPFPSRRIVVVSRFPFPYMLIAADQEVITLMESWDHPAKLPVGYTSDKVFVWNRELGEDWVCYQGDTNISIGYPLKLRYALNETQLPLQVRQASRPCALYAAGASSLTYIKTLYTDELRVIREVCLATRQAGWRLIIKPKPNGKRGDFDSFSAEFDHVEIGEYGDVQGTSEYYLDDEYNRRRFDQLRSCDLVINTFTTFALDAALAGLPVLQLDLRKHLGLTQIAASLTNQHIERHLLGRHDLVYAPSPDLLLHHGLAELLTNSDNRAQRFSEYLRGWLTPLIAFDEALAVLVSSILTEKL